MGSIFFILFIFIFSSPASAAYSHTFSYVAGGAPGTADCVLLSSCEQNGSNDIYVVTLPYDTTAITSVTNVDDPMSLYTYGVKINICETLAKIPFGDGDLIHNTDFTTETSYKYWEYFYMSDYDDYYVSQAVADAGYTLITTNVKGFGFRWNDLDGNFFKVIVQLTGSTGPVTVDKTALNEAITAAETVKAADYWTADDRWDGTNTYSGTEGGFWADFQAKLTAAQAVAADDNATVVGVSDATTALIAAQPKLMPKTKVNATLLHELVNNVKHLESQLYTEKTWLPFELARTNGQSILAGLYGILGNDDASKQPAVDNAYGDLKTAKDNLLAPSQLQTAQRYHDAILSLGKLFRLSESESSKYTADSWAAYTDARDAANALFDSEPINDSLTGTVFKEYETKTISYYNACYSLKADDDITVHFHISDNLGAKYPQYALTDQRTAAFDGDVTLNTGNTTVDDLINTAGLIFAANMSGAGEAGIFEHWSVYVNGVRVAHPYEGYSLGNSDVSLKNGDDVTFVRAEYPMAMYYISKINAGYSGYKDFLSVLSIKDVTAPIEVKEGESFSLTVNKTAGDLSAYPAASRPAANVSLVYSDPADSEAAVSGAVHDSGAVTDSEGHGELALYQAGWYTVSTVDIRNQTLGAVALDGSESGGVYPNLAAGDSVLVHVLSLEEAELAAALDGYQDKLDALLAQYSKEAFGSTLWKQVQSAYYAAKSGVYSSTSLAGAQSALDTCKTTLDGLQTQAKTANAKVLSDISWYLNRLPNVDQIGQGLFNQNDINYYQFAAAIYNGMSAYQKGQLTAAQVAQYQALTAAYGADGSALPAAQTYTLTVKCEPVEYGDKISMGASNHINIGPNEYDTSIVYPAQNLSTPFTCQFRAGTDIAMSLQKANLASGYEFNKIESDFDGMEYYAGPGMSTSSLFIYRNYETIPTPRANITVTVHIRQVGELTLDEAKDAAKTALTAEFGTYDNAYYTVGRWNELVQAYKEGLAAIAAATSKAVVDSAKTDAFAAMAAVPERSPGDYGSVKVEFYNNTYAAGMGYDAEAPFISKTMELTADDTMMTVALRAAHEEGYTWTGTGGSGYNINYLSSLSKEGKTLSEFGNGSESGWMGTLNDWFVHQSFATFGVNSTDPDTKLRDADIIKVMYTSKGLGADLGGTWGNGDTSLKALAVDGITLANNFSATTLNYVATVDSSLLGSDISMVPTAANKNFQVRTFLNTKNTTGWYRPGETIPAAAGDIIYIGVAEKAWPTMNKVGAEAVAYTPTWYTIYVVGEGEDSINQLISLIDALPAVDSAALTNKAAVDFAKTYYDTLSESDQAKVTNVAKLNDLLQRMDDLQQVVDIKAAIDALPSAANVTKADAEAINAVFDTYTALKQWQKNLIVVSYTDKLNAVKEAIDLLTGDPAAIVTNLINALPAADQITLANQAAVEKARTAYDNLSAEKQNEVTSVTLNKLIAAEKAIKALADAAILPVNDGKVTTLKPEATVANEAATVNLADETVSNLGDSAQSNGSTEIIIAPKDLGDANPVTFTLNQAALGGFLEKTAAELTLASPIANVTLSNAALTALNAAGSGPISVIIEQTAGDTVKVTVKNGDTVLTDLGAITVKITASDIDENTVVAQINSDGSKTVLSNASIVSNLSASAVTVSPKYTLRVPVSGSVTLQLIDNAQTFTDINGHWAVSYIEFVTARGLMQGTGNSKFSPDLALTRGMLVTILWRLDGEPVAQGGAVFSDVAAGKYYNAAVAWAAENEIVTGVGSGKFKPEDNVSRQDMVVIMTRYAAYRGMTVTGDMSLIEGYSDFGQISGYAQEAFAWAYQAEIVNGTSKTALSPQGNATRAQFAAVLQRFIALLPY
ncbi:MAG TPA: S-layer homology domain-containing protein [Clostridiales bacterium]|nr:S-layer homology domain-containing protein [Clostridiales bacterium]